MSESEVQQEIQTEAMKMGTQLWRNNSGALKDETGRTVRFGLGNISKKSNEISKSSDLIGGTQVVITPDMVGKTIFIFTAIEVKSNDRSIVKDKRYQGQKNYIELVKVRGGIAGFAQSTTDLKNIIKDYMSALIK